MEGKLVQQIQSLKNQSTRGWTLGLGPTGFGLHRSEAGDLGDVRVWLLGFGTDACSWNCFDCGSWLTPQIYSEPPESWNTGLRGLVLGSEDADVPTLWILL